MRSTTFALLGITAALALGLVAIAAQQVWPDLPFSPLPGPATKQGEVHDALVVAQPGGTRIGSAQPAGRSGTAAAAAPSDGPVTDKGGSRLSESHQLESSGAGEEPAPDAPSGQDAVPSPGQSEPPPSGPPAAVPTPTPESSPAPTAPAVSSPSKPEPVAVSATKDLDQGKDDDKARAYGKYKPSSGKGGKSEKDEKSSYAESKAPPPAPTVVEADEHAEEKEAEEGKDESPAYRGKGGGNAYGHKGK